MRRWVFAFVLAFIVGRIGCAGAVTEGEDHQGRSADSLAVAVKGMFDLLSVEWRLGECFLGFGDLEERATLGEFVIGYWISEGDSVWLFKVADAESGVEVLALRLLAPVYTDSLLERHARSGMLDCAELQAQRGKLFEVWVVPSERAAKLGSELLDELGHVQVPVVQHYKLHAERIELFAISAVGLERAFISLAPPSPSLSRWLNRFREVILKEGVEKPRPRQPGSGGSSP